MRVSHHGAGSKGPFPGSASTDANRSLHRAAVCHATGRTGRRVLVAAALVMLGTSVTAPVETPVLTATDGRLVFPVDQRMLTTEVERAPLALDVTLRGRLEAIDNAVVVSECYRTIPLIELAPEGSWVEQGDVVARLDPSEVDFRIDRERLDKIEVDARLASAEQALKMQKLTAAAKRAKAELAVRLTQLDLESYRNGEFPQQLNEGKNKLALAEEAVVRERKMVEYQEEMARLGYEPFAEVESARAKLAAAELEYQTAAGALTVLTEHTRGRELTALSTAAQTARDELERVIATNRTNLITREIAVETARKSQRRQDEYLDKLFRAKEACTLRAPRAGRVVHAKLSDSRSSESVQEGTVIRERQAVVEIPRFDRMKVAIRIHESQVRHMRPGLPVSVTVEADRERIFPGHIESVSSVPVSGNWPNYDLKEYPAVVVLDDDFGEQADATLRPGLTAHACVHVDSRPQCRQVPVQSLVPIVGEDREQMTVFVHRGDEVEVRAVTTGLATAAMIEVTEGLEPGETIVLSPRTDLSKELTELHAAAGRSGSRLENG